MNGRRRFILSTFLFSTVLFGDKKSPSNLTLRDFVAAIAGLFLRRLCDPSLFHTLQFNIARDYNSMLREITNHCCERLQIIVARDYNSMLREITIQCCERLQFNVARDYNSMLREITIQCCERLHFIITRDYNSMLREITLVFELYNPP
jgi:phosphate uptake regulator